MIKLYSLSKESRPYIETAVNEFYSNLISITEAAKRLNSRLDADLIEKAVVQCHDMGLTPVSHRELATRILSMALMSRGEERKYGNALRYHGLTCKELDQYERAVDAFETSATILIECSAPEDAAMSLIHLGHIHKIKGWHSEAIAAYDKTIDHMRESDKPRLLGSSLLWRADCHERKGQVELAAAGYKEAATILDNGEDSEDWLTGFAWLGCAVTEKKLSPDSDVSFMVKKADQFFDELSEDEARKTDYFRLSADIREQASRVLGLRTAVSPPDIPLEQP